MERLALSRLHWALRKQSGSTGLPYGKFFQIFLLTFLVSVPNLQRANADPITCSQVRAPAKFRIGNPAVHGLKATGNAGIAPAGFVSLKSGEPVIHGIDVSKWQDHVDFLGAKECGATFAYIRISSGTDPTNETMYRVFWPNARAAGLIPGPYHNLSILPNSSKLWVQDTPSDRAAILQSLLNFGERSARGQAQYFLKRLNEVLLLDPIPDRTTKDPKPSFLPIALDLSNDPVSNGSAQDKHEFGKIFGTMACAWVDEVRRDRTFGKSKIIIFAKPSIYRDYALADAPCDLLKLPVWISTRRLDGDKFDAAPVTDEIRDLCRPNLAANRCQFEQYTSYGSFITFQKKAPADLDRFYGNRAEFNSWIQQYNGGK